MRGLLKLVFRVIRPERSCHVRKPCVNNVFPYIGQKTMGLDLQYTSTFLLNDADSMIFSGVINRRLRVYNFCLRYGPWVYSLLTLLAVLLLSTNLQIQNLLPEPIRAELKLTNTQLAQLHGMTVVLFGALAAFPIGWLADRWDRRWVLLLCVMFWSSAIYAGGLVPGLGWWRPRRLLNIG
jgi:MFS family permease